MTVEETVKNVIADVESLTGCPVLVTQDAAIRNMSVLEMARGPIRLHQIRIHPNFRHEAAYLTCFECGIILRKFGVPPQDRKDFAADPNGQREFEGLVEKHFAADRMPREMLRGISADLIRGLLTQLFSVPSSLRVDSWIEDAFPALHAQQKKLVARQLQEALTSLSPEARQIAPAEIVRPSQMLNAAHAAFWSRRWEDPLLTMPYRAAKFAAAAERLLALFDATPGDPEHDHVLVDAWAKELGVNRLFRWIPYQVDES